MYFHQTFGIGAFWDKDERFSFRFQKVKGQGHSMTKGPVGRGIQSLTPCVEWCIFCFCSVSLCLCVLLMDPSRLIQISRAFSEHSGAQVLCVSTVTGVGAKSLLPNVLFSWAVYFAWFYESQNFTPVRVYLRTVLSYYVSQQLQMP